MAIKLASSTADGVELPKISAAQESIWTRISDTVAYMFTSNSSMAEKIGNMCYWLDHMDEDQVEALEAARIDGKVQTYENMSVIMSFSAQAVDFCLKNLPKYEGMEYALNDDHRKKIEDEMENTCSTFESSHDRDEVARLRESGAENVGEEPTLAKLGYTHPKLTEFAKKFKADQAGRLGKIRKLKFITNMTAYQPKNGKVKLVNIAARNFGVILSDAIKSYEHVDKFLFRIYREMKRQKIILH